jgi:DNA-binding HxlR family transcriptional regulator
MHQKGHKLEFTCPIERTLSVVGNKWTLLIIRDLLKGTKRFGELQNSLEGISPRTLSKRLQELEEQKIIRKKVYPEIPPHTDYTLTVKGEGLAEILEDMIEWDKRN